MSTVNDTGMLRRSDPRIMVEIHANRGMVRNCNVDKAETHQNIDARNEGSAIDHWFDF